MKRKVVKVNFKKKRFTRKRKAIPKSLALLPRRHLARMKYVETFVLDPIAIGIADVVFRANDLYDPYYALGGHQPLGFDQMMQLYKRFFVLGCKATVKFASKDETSLSSTCIVGLMQSSDPTLLTNVTTVIEQPKSRWSYVQLGDTVKNLSLKYSTKKAQGVTNILDNSELSGTITSSPLTANTDFIHVFAATPPGLADSSPVTACLVIEYIAIFVDPIQLNQS